MGTTELPASPAVFEPIWNAVHIDHVDISWLESLTLEGRASYYDQAGACAVTTPAAETMRSRTVRARYTAGTIGIRQVPSYVDEPGVDPSRNTPKPTPASHSR
jgi:glucose-6-phosphate 1-dehydrogenase